MVNDKEYVISSFESNFSKYKNEPIVIYGVGVNTKLILDTYPDYNIVGLMDEVRTGDIVFGKKVLSKEEVLQNKVKTIVIIARSTSVDIIYRRISLFCAENDISVFDINGQLQKEIDYSEIYKFKSDVYSEIKEEKLLDLIEQNEVISFDVFDTVIMRNVLLPSDIFDIMESRLSNNDSKYANFAILRKKAEYQLYTKGINPSLREIYEELTQISSISLDEIDGIMNLEFELELEHIVAREKVRDIICRIRDNKKVCFTSDMYLSSEQIRSLLEKCGVPAENTPIYVSNEYGVSKHNGLFKIVRSEYENCKILHIGDNEVADINAARAYGINSTFKLNSAYDMLLDSTAAKLTVHSSVLSDRLVLGNFIRYQFNNPFLFEKTAGKLDINNDYLLGYCFVAPVISVFINWLVKKCNELKLDGILLSARDGYLLNSIFEELKKDDNALNIPPFKYFYASRKVCLLANINSAEDIKYIAEMTFSGSAELMLKVRFGIEEQALLNRNEDESDMDYILRHAALIVDNSKKLRQKYLTYMEKQNIDTKAKYAFFDFVSSGSCQLGLNNMLNLVGLYFARNYDERKKDLQIFSLYESTSIYQKQDALIEKYVMLENIFSSFEPSLKNFAEDGSPVFEKETRGDKQFESLKSIQAGIADAVKYYATDNSCNNVNLADVFLELISNQYSNISAEYFINNPLIDEFCNLSFDAVLAK